MRRGFTFIEVIFVVVVLGILAAIAVPRLLPKDELGLATDQVISHIRYTQHLAMMDQRYDATKPDWKDSYWRFSRDGANTYSIIRGPDGATAKIFDAGYNEAGVDGYRTSFDLRALFVTIELGCAGAIGFDELGRPVRFDTTAPEFIENDCIITLRHSPSNQQMIITINPETGYIF